MLLKIVAALLASHLGNGKQNSWYYGKQSSYGNGKQKSHFKGTPVWF